MFDSPHSPGAIDLQAEQDIGCEREPMRDVCYGFDSLLLGALPEPDAALHSEDPDPVAWVEPTMTRPEPDVLAYRVVVVHNHTTGVPFQWTVYPRGFEVVGFEHVAEGRDPYFHEFTKVGPDGERYQVRVDFEQISEGYGAPVHATVTARAEWPPGKLPPSP